MSGPAIVVLGAGGLSVAQQIKDVIPGCRIHGLARRMAHPDIEFDDAGKHLRELFTDGTPIIGVCAAGILIRVLSTVLNDKTTEPPVVAVAEDGSAVVPLLGGHHGANSLANQIGGVFGVLPAVTTAGDARFGIDLENPPYGWILGNPDDVKSFVADLLDNETVLLDDSVPTFVRDGRVPLDLGGTLQVSETVYDVTGNTHHLVYHPAAVAVGVGCERGTAQNELIGLVNRTLKEANISRRAVAGIFSLDLKEDEPAIHAVAETLGVSARFFGANELEAQSPRLENPSEIVFREVGCHGVAEGAALAAVGASGKLIVGKHKAAHSTCALAVSAEPIDVALKGKERGKVFILGTGPGSDGWMTGETEAAVSCATDLVGYTLYLDLLGERTEGKTCHGFPLGKETERVRAALDIAASGKSVALVSSGDPGIYAMATLVFELMGTEKRFEWKRLAITVCPGVSAMQALAARIGAPLGNDFCTISLSDLLTPWTAIQRRVHAAAEGDFVIAFYNPVSLKRTWQLAQALEILLEYRPETTPVIIGRNLGREDEKVRSVTLGTINPMEIDMLTMVLVGSSETRSIDRGDDQKWVYTPRGYQGKQPHQTDGTS